MLAVLADVVCRFFSSLAHVRVGFDVYVAVGIAFGSIAVAVDVSGCLLTLMLTLPVSCSSFSSAFHRCRRFLPDVRTAQHAWEKSCYFNIDYKIDEGNSVYDAISRMSAYNVGCLIVTKNGVVSNRLFSFTMLKITSPLGRTSEQFPPKHVGQTPRDY